MPDFENKLGQMGQAFARGGQGLIKRQWDDPIVEAQQRRAEEDRRMQAELTRKALLERMANQQQRNQGIPEVPSMEGQSPQHQDMRTRAMISAMENLGNIDVKEAKMRQAQEAQDAMMAQDRSEFNPNEYQDVNPQAPPPVIPPARFGNLKSRLQGQRGNLTEADASPFNRNVMSERGSLTNQDINSIAPQPQVGAIELSEDPEEMQRQIQAARLGR